MPNTPQDAYSPSDADLDEIVNEAFADEGTSTPVPDATSSAPASSPPAATRPETTSAANTAGGAEDEDDAPARQPATAATEGDPAPGAAPPAPPATPPGDAKPFQFKAAGGVHVLAGASELPDGSVVIAKDAQPEFRRILASERELRQNFTQLRRESQRQLAALKTERTDKDLEADAISGLFAELKKMTPDERWEFFQRFEEETPKLEAAIERKKLERDRAALQREREGPPLLEEEKQEQVTQLVTNELQTTFRTLTQHADAKLFTREELRALYDKWSKRAPRLLRQATDDGDGYKKGQVLFDDAEVWEDFALLADVKRRASASAGPSGAAAVNAARNADQQPGNPIPPAIAPVRPAAGDGKNKTPSYAGNRKGWKNEFMAGKLDDEE